MATAIVIDQKTLEHAVRKGYSQIKKSFVDDIINKSKQSDAIRQVMANFLGLYKSVNDSIKTAIKEQEYFKINYFESEALLDSYSSYIAANESLYFLSSKNITKKREAKTLFRNNLDFVKYERNPQLREMLVTNDLLAKYFEAANNLNHEMIPDLTINYFEWVMLQSIRTKDSINNPSFEEWTKKHIIILQSKNEYNGFRNLEDKARKIHCENTTPDHNGERPYSFLVRDIPQITFKDVGGLEQHKELIYEAIKLPIEKKDEFREKGVEAPKGLIFYGEKGCGKTFIAKAVSNELGLPFFYANGSEFRQKFLGDGPKIIRQLFSDARALAPSLIFIDEIDACLLEVGSEEGRFSRDIVNQMLTEIDGFNILDSVKVIVGTNHYNAIDNRFTDRFPLRYHLEFKLPDTEARHKALYAITRKMKTGNIDLDLLASQTQGANFRALYFICNSAGLYSIKESSHNIEQKHFDMSLKDYSKNPKTYMN